MPINIINPVIESNYNHVHARKMYLCGASIKEYIAVVEFESC